MFKRLSRLSIELLQFLYDWSMVTWQLIRGIILISKAPRPRITFFGGSRLKLDDPYAIQAAQLAERLAKFGISIMTGGGPGLMEAVSLGALKANQKESRIIGIAVENLSEPVIKRSGVTILVMKYFFARKWLLTQYATGFVIFPGGLGTLDEFIEVATLIQTGKLKKLPLILFGSAYWAQILLWLKEQALPYGQVAQADIDLITITDDINKVYEILVLECKGADHCRSE